jgi:hypothetical protein
MINDLGLAISGQCTCTIVVNKIGLRSTRYDPERTIYTGLDVDNTSHMPLNEGPISQAVACINLGDEPTYFFFINLTMRRILEVLRFDRLLQASNSEESHTAGARLFLYAYKYYPVVRLALMPGEGVLIPAATVIHDGGTLEKTEPEILLKIGAHFILNSD